ncbi:hypothetical protein BGZ54_009616 [Gamsiella multidivaricata]|nr:hypothetical protein BGZ54_009616 [Gamsiella multidivaricata]
MKAILRSDIPHYHDTTIRIVEEQQRIVSQVIVELSALAHKALILAVDGQFYNSALNLHTVTQDFQPP